MADDRIMTPAGYRRPSQVHLIEPHQVLSLADDRMRIIDQLTNTTVKEISQVARPQEEGVKAHLGWIAYTGWTNETGNPITSFRTTFQVPAPPENMSDYLQYIYFFPGIENSTGLLQPVLGWYTSPTGGYWALQCTYALNGGDVTVGPRVEVNQGDTVVGFITLTGRWANQFSYICGFDGFPQTNLQVQFIEELTWCVEALEAYLDPQIDPCEQYPPTGRMIFQNISIQTGDTYPTLDWQPTNLVTSCGENAQVVSNANPEGIVCINYATLAPGWYWSGFSNPAGVRLYQSVGVCALQQTPGAPQFPLLFIEGRSGHSPVSDLWCNRWTGIQWVWSNLGTFTSDTLDAPVGVVTVQDSQDTQQAWVFLLGQSGTSLWLNSSDGSTGQWSNLGAPPKAILTQPVGVVMLRDSPQALQQSSAFIVGSDGNLWLNMWNGTSGAWSDLRTPLGVSLIEPLGVLTMQNNPQAPQQPCVFLKGSDGNLWWNRWDGFQWFWDNLGAPSVGIESRVGAVAVQDNPQAPQRPYIFVKGGDGNLWWNWWDGSQWSWSVQLAPTGVSLGTGAGVITVQDNAQAPQRPYAYLEGDDGNLWCNYWDGSQWSWSNQGNPEIAGVGLGSPAGIWAVTDDARTPQRPYIYFQATDGIIRYNWLA